MIVNNTNISPPQELLDKCQQVLIADPRERLGAKPREIKKWAQTYCRSFVWFELMDVSDVSPLYDVVCAYYFSDPRDVTMFTLRWSS